MIDMPLNNEPTTTTSSLVEKKIRASWVRPVSPLIQMTLFVQSLLLQSLLLQSLLQKRDEPAAEHRLRVSCMWLDIKRTPTMELCTTAELWYGEREASSLPSPYQRGNEEASLFCNLDTP